MLHTSAVSSSVTETCSAPPLPRQQQLTPRKRDRPFELAAIYACRISQAHSFADGNKRTALLVAIGFLEANGIDTSHYSQKDLVDWLVEVAEKKIDQNGFARRLRCASGLAAIVE